MTGDFPLVAKKKRLWETVYTEVIYALSKLNYSLIEPSEEKEKVKLEFCFWCRLKTLNERFVLAKLDENQVTDFHGQNKNSTIPIVNVAWVLGK